MLRLFRVSEDSLSPAYRDGDFVLTAKIPVFLYKLRPGDIIAFQYAHYGRMIKRIESITDEGKLYVLGTHEFSVDSREFGLIPAASVIGKVIWHIRKPRPSINA